MIFDKEFINERSTPAAVVEPINDNGIGSYVGSTGIIKVSGAWTEVNQLFASQNPHAYTTTDSRMAFLCDGCEGYVGNNAAIFGTVDSTSHATFRIVNGGFYGPNRTAVTIANNSSTAQVYLDTDSFLARFGLSYTGVVNLSSPPPVVNGFLNMESTSSYWSICDGSCAGGGGTPSVGPTQTFSLSAPSEVSFTATANSTNVLFVSKPPGAWNASSNDFTFDVWYYPTNATGVNEHEFDQVMVTASATEWMFGHQCVVGGVWDIWNQSSLTWIPTSSPCSLSVNAWHHLIFHDYKIAGDTTGCGGYGCMYFGSLTVDGVIVYNLNQAEPAGATPGGWTSFAGAQVQEDVNSASVGSPVSVVSYYKWINFTQRN